MHGTKHLCKPEWPTPWFLGQLLKDFIWTYCGVPQLRGCFDTLITPLPTPCLDNMCSEAVIKIESTVSVSSIDDRVCSPSHCRRRSTLKCRIGLCAFIFFVAIYWSASCLYCPPEIGRILGYMHTAYFHSFAFATLQYYFSPPQCMVCLFTTCARKPRLSCTSFSRTFFFCL